MAAERAITLQDDTSRLVSTGLGNQVAPRTGTAGSGGGSAGGGGEAYPGRKELDEGERAVLDELVKAGLGQVDHVRREDGGDRGEAGDNRRGAHPGLYLSWSVWLCTARRKSAGRTRMARWRKTSCRCSAAALQIPLDSVANPSCRLSRALSIFLSIAEHPSL